jgi:exodeoxyribonuclease VII large subunit
MPEDRELARVSTGSAVTILSVSELARSVRDLLEHRYPLLWVAGEISNLTLAKSGHAYFLLKDALAQVRCVAFRHRLQVLDWSPREGMKVEVQALITLYEPRGDFQLNIETMRRAGLGALYEAFLRLRERLEKQGLFDAAAKRPLPEFPRTLGVVTSLQAAALHDVLSTLARRNPSIHVVIYPVPVQGEGAAAKIAAALTIAGSRGECDALLLVRGGGSIEDLWAFNEEAVALAIRACPIPVVTGIGHETDFTIADFAADRRAHTPTAAAELLSPERAVLLERIAALCARLSGRALRDIETRMQLLDHLGRRIVHPAARLRAQGETLAHLRSRLSRATHRVLDKGAWRAATLAHRARSQLPAVAELERTVLGLARRLLACTGATLDRTGARIGALATSLEHLAPLRVLERGYTLVSRADGSVVRDSAGLEIGESLSLRFARGCAHARVQTRD